MGLCESEPDGFVTYPTLEETYRRNIAKTSWKRRGLPRADFDKCMRETIKNTPMKEVGASIKRLKQIDKWTIPKDQIQWNIDLCDLLEKNLRERMVRIPIKTSFE